jgi:hypothetical protein
MVFREIRVVILGFVIQLYSWSLFMARGFALGPARRRQVIWYFREIYVFFNS